MRSRLLLLVLVSLVACSAERAISPQPKPERAYRLGCDHEGHCGMRLMPLLIVDGQLRLWDFGEKNLRPEDIENIEILKGEKAVDRFGADARDGVLVISTKAAQKR
jgi:hypothetical protein